MKKTFFKESVSFQQDKFQSNRSEKDWFASASSEEKTDNYLNSTSFNSGDSVLLEGCSVRGAFEAKGNLRINGFVEGDLFVEGVVTIGESAVIRANIRARGAVIFGKVVGDVLCPEKIELQMGAQVRGNIKTKKLLIQDGVIFDGRCEMSGDFEKSKNETGI